LDPTPTVGKVTTNPLPDEVAAVHEACALVGVPSAGPQLLRRHANTTYLLPQADVVLRLGATGADAFDKARRAVAVTRWLTRHEFPAVEPVDVPQPLALHVGVVSFWRYYPQHLRGYPPVECLGTLLHDLHEIGAPPMELPPYEPLQSFTGALAAARGLSDDDLAFLAGTRARLLAAYADLQFILPSGLIHGDAARSNLLWDGDRPVLADWDAVCIGPREQDLALTHQNARFGLPAQQRRAFADRYGYDVTGWDGYTVLRDIQELHTLTSFIRLAPTDPAAATQLRHRITCLRHGDLTTSWTAF
ncbi:MAG TPA: aminoglycoside phosphotransferase family protein, partial [Kineosporiaceae bacterium]|nr:aminoglycoside phosphotransferase family protein [Kineosporiaceae bacterium]